MANRYIGTDDTIRIRPGRVRDRGTSRPVRVRPRPATFIGEVHQAIRRAGGDPNRLAGKGKSSGRFNARGRGAKVAAGLKGRNGWSRSLTGQRTRSRRVAVKARVVKLNPQRGGRRGRQFVSAKAVDAHLRYLERDGVTRDGEKGQVYSAERDVDDGHAFLERGREDRHQFRFIVSAEEGVELSDLRATTRDMMKQMESDLDTRLDWIAVDHHNTGHPHTHILLRGVTDQGKALNIAGDYIAHGIRERASEIVTLELGRQTEHEVSQQLQAEVHAERFTRLDRMLIAEQEARNEFADLRPDKDMRAMFRRNRALLIDRARHLERMGLATEVTPGRWRIAPKAESTLRELGTRSDIIKTMHRALDEASLADSRRGARYVLHGAELAEPVTGRVLSKGLGSDELGERVHLVVDGVYSPSEHLEVARAQAKELRTDPEMFVKAHVRRLEALRRAGIVERIHAEHWTIPADLPERGLAHDLKRDGRDARLKLLSPIPLSQQVAHDGATWLDRELTARPPPSVAAHGFGQELTEALDRRAQRLVDMGHAKAKDGHISIPRKTVAVLERREIDRIGKALAAERGRTWEPAQTGNYVAGTLVGSTRLASGRFAMIDDGLGFSLVPWSPPLEKQLGKHITGIAMPGGGIDWELGRQRGLGI